METFNLQLNEKQIALIQVALLAYKVRVNELGVNVPIVKPLTALITNVELEIGVQCPDIRPLTDFTL